MDEWIDGWMDEDMDERMDEGIGGGMKDRWMGVKTDGWMEEWRD
jgi:hypothetical protein